MKTFTSVDADRLLGLADQFIEDWEETARESGDVPELKRALKRKEEFAAIRPLLMAAPKLAAFTRKVADMGRLSYSNLTAADLKALVDEARSILSNIKNP